MSDFIHNPSQKPYTPALPCADFEARLTEFVENTLPPAESQILAQHAATCDHCRVLLTQAQQGHQWLQLLHDEPLEPPASLVASILARTSGLANPVAVRGAASKPHFGLHGGAVMGDPFKPPFGLSGMKTSQVPNPSIPASLPRPWKPARFPALVTMRRTVFDPRLSLTAAMAFFSISLTLNLLGVHLNAFRPSNFTAKNLRLTVTRQYVMANSSVVRYYENLRFVYEVESSVQQLRRAAESESDNTPDSSGQPSKSKSQNPAPGKSGSSNQDQRPGQQPFARTPSAPLLKPLAPHAPARIQLGPTLEASLAGAPDLASETWASLGRPVPPERSAV